MKLTASEIAKITDGKIIGGGSEIITGANGLNEASKEDISFLSNMKYLSDAINTRAGILFVSEDCDISVFQNRAIIKVKNPQYAYGIILSVIDKEKIESYKPQIFDGSYISDKAQIGQAVYVGSGVAIEDGACIGDSSRIFANVYIGRNVKIGKNCIIYPNVVIRENVLIGDRVIIQPGVVIGGDGFGFATVGGKNQKIPQIGRVEIGDDVEIGANTTIDRATTDATRIGKGTKIDNLVMIAHNVQIGENCIIVAQAGISGSTKIGNNVIIGGQTGIVGHLKIGDNVMIASQAGISGDIKDGQKIGGNPMSELNHSIRVRALIRKLPEIYQDFKNLKNKINSKEE
ncbi:MAG: UDP-3-O-(3-hydroxymyristoyl)glucosamine N-acyltransferase [Elusimicrobiota bacterium]|jgi:UDP-3-O-[3-hydroxymyristoyl] glucosamine N-acyltransferase|nr:UDP-3-O-(3-hydroxymyristoyl)glucosamine N-acyltransferase [Elusimicrobiota bacterium]